MTARILKILFSVQTPRENLAHASTCTWIGTDTWPVTVVRGEGRREKCVAVMQTRVQCTEGKVESLAYIDSRHLLSSKQTCSNPHKKVSSHKNLNIT